MVRTPYWTSAARPAGVNAVRLSERTTAPQRVSRPPAG